MVKKMEYKTYNELADAKIGLGWAVIDQMEAIEKEDFSEDILSEQNGNALNMIKGYYEIVVAAFQRDADEIHDVLEEGLPNPDVEWLEKGVNAIEAWLEE